MNFLKNKEIIFFDLDRTLFDHNYSLKNAMVAVKTYFSKYFEYKDIEELIQIYNESLDFTFQQYLDGLIDYEETHYLKIKKFFDRFEINYTDEDIYKFRKIHKKAYNSELRATSGSIETLEKLRKCGYTLCILTNGTREVQTQKAQNIGVTKLVERILTSEELSVSKPAPLIFQKALAYFNKKPENAIMVGDSIESDIKGALEIGITPILYKPLANDKEIILDGKKVLVIKEMMELLEILNFKNVS